MYAKARRTFTTSLHSKATESIITTWKSHILYAVCLVYVLSQSLESSDWFTGFAIWRVLLKCVNRHLRCLMPAVQIFMSIVRSGLAIGLQTVSCSICCTEHQPWISQPRCRDCTCCLPGENLRHFLHSNVVYLWSFLAVVSFSDLQNTQTQLLS